MNTADAKRILETALICSPQPLSVRDLRVLFNRDFLYLGVFAKDSLGKKALRAVDFKQLEERVYRHRCVEAWSMVMPWVGVPIKSVLDKGVVQSPLLV